MEKRLTVLFPITDLSMDGAQRQLLELARGLNKERFKPIILTLRPGGALEQEFREIPELQLLFLKQSGKYNLLCLFKVFSILRRMKVDVVQPFLTPATLFGLLPSLLCRTSVKIATERNSPGRKDVGLGYRLYLGAEDFLCRFADWAIPNSEAGRGYLIRRGINPSHIRVIYNGINLSRLAINKECVEQVRQRLSVPPGGKVVGIMARLFPQKDHATFLRAAAIVNHIISETRFAILGDGPLRRDLEELSLNLGLDSKVVFFGEQEDVAAYLAAFDIAVLTSHAEGCSNTLLEAMALEKPVVATDVGGNRELVHHEETGLLVPCGNAEAVAEAVVRLLRDEQAASAMGRRAQETVVTQFSVESMVRQYQSLYEETLVKKVSDRKKRGKSE